MMLIRQTSDRQHHRTLSLATSNDDLHSHVDEDAGGVRGQHHDASCIARIASPRDANLKDGQAAAAARGLR